MEKVRIFDTTLRDGEQTPGVNLNIQEKIDIAKQLAKLGIDVIEPGFPVTSAGDFEAVQRISREVIGPTICGFTRAIIKDIDKTWEAIKDAPKKCFHLFISSSDIQIKHQLRKTEEEVIKIVENTISHAKNYTEEIEFSPMDASRTRREFLFEIIEKAIAAGATVINIPDTVGYSNPLEFGQTIKDVKDKVCNIDKAIISVHCHNDLGMAVANSLAAVQNGARQIETTINGIGERAGNAAFEEVVMYLNTRKDFFDLETNIDLSQIYKTSSLVSKYTNLPIPVNKPVVGKYVFSHESGIHQDGVLKERSTYEIMDPKAIGREVNNLVLGKHSGRHALKQEAEKLGYNLNEEQVVKLFDEFKALTDRKKEVTINDLEALITGEVDKALKSLYEIENLEVSCGSKKKSQAKVSLHNKRQGQLIESQAEGNGPVDATFKAINNLIPESKEIKLLEYNVSAITEDIDSLGKVSVTLSQGEKVISGLGNSTDVVMASAMAYIDALNKCLA